MEMARPGATSRKFIGKWEHTGGVWRIPHCRVRVPVADGKRGACTVVGQRVLVGRSMGRGFALRIFSDSRDSTGLKAGGGSHETLRAHA